MIGGVLPAGCLAASVALLQSDQPPAAAPARRGRGGQGRGRSRLRAEDGGGHGHPQRPVPGQALRPGQAQRSDGRRDQSDFRQGDAERAVRPGHAHAAAGDPVEHVAGPAADGGLPVHLAHLGALVHLLHRVVQRAGGPGLFRRQRDQRARAADAGTALDDDRFALAHPHRQADFRAEGIVRADGLHHLAAVAGLALAAVDVLVRQPDDPSLPGDRGPDGADDDHAGHVLLGDLFADEREPDDDLS